MMGLLLWTFLFFLGTVIAYKMIHNSYRPPTGMHIILFFIFALPLYLVFAFIPLMIVHQKTKHKPVAPPGVYKLQQEDCKPSFLNETIRRHTSLEYKHLPMNIHYDD